MAGLLSGVPTIDLSAFREGSPEARAAVARDVGRACREVGFFVATGHEVPQYLIDRLLAASRAFFDQPEGQKLALRPERGGSLGYFPLATEKASTSNLCAPPDLKERFAIGPLEDDECLAPPEAQGFIQPNLWPVWPSDFKFLLRAYYLEMVRLSARLLQIVALDLGLPAAFFADKIDRQLSFLVSLSYPDLGSLAPLPGQMRAGAHRDRACFALIAANDDPGGLQVCREGGAWEDLCIPRGAVVVNTGSLMARWTGGAWAAPLHRVVNPPPEAAGRSRRQSLVFFFNPNADVLLRPLVPGPGVGEYAGAEPITAGQHLRSMLDLHTRGVGSHDPRAAEGPAGHRPSA